MAIDCQMQCEHPADVRIVDVPRHHIWLDVIQCPLGECARWFLAVPVPGEAGTDTPSSTPDPKEIT